MMKREELEQAILEAEAMLKRCHAELMKAQARRENAEAARIEKELER